MICPKCKSNLEGGLIYEHFLQEYGDENKALEIAALYGATKTEGRWGREIGIYCLDRDRTVAYKCPDCDNVWDREYNG